MTSEHWRRIEALFGASLRLSPADQQVWLRGACSDDEVRAKVTHLLLQDERADRDGFLMLSDSAAPSPDRTATWSSRPGGRPRVGLGSLGRGGGPRPSDSGNFVPRTAIAMGSRPQPGSTVDSADRARLRELPIIYIFILAMAALWNRLILKNGDSVIYEMDASVILILSGIVLLLSSRRPLSLAQFRFLELAVIGVFACRLAVVQYRLILEFSSAGNPMMAHMIMKNVIAFVIIVILTYGFCVPKTWLRSALVVGPLTLLPFATLFVLSQRHPGAMAWLWRGWGEGGTPWFCMYGFDAMVLLILGAGSTFGAHAISRLRLQVAEFRQLGQYRLRRQIGEGGMGEVYLAEHQLLKRPCALKLIRPDRLSDPRVLARFEREVRLTATLSHPNTVEIYDYGRTECGTFYYVMEYLPGLSLADLVEAHGPLPSARVVYLLRQVCLALGEAHAAGLIHRDIKTSNIFSARRGGMDDVAKLLDFGLVRPTAAAAPTDAEGLSDEGQILGTPHYMSPEQAMGQRELDERSDIYSLGAVAYHLLTSRPPFDESSGIAVLIALARDPVIPPSLICPGIPHDLENVVLRCLAKEPADRYPDADSLERALAACACAGDWDKDCAARWWREVGDSLIHRKQ